MKKMAEDIDLNGDPNSKKDSKNSEAKDESAKTVPLQKLFSFDDPLDHFLMFMGFVGAIRNGISMALMTLEISSIHLEEPKSPTKLLMKFLR